MIRFFSQSWKILVLGLLVIVQVAYATYPEKPIKLIVPFSPGGGTDLVARTVAEGMSRDLNQAVIVENKPGAGTVIGTDYVAKSTPDGYTLIVATFAQAVNPSLIKNLPYNASRDLIPVAMVGNSPNVLVVLPNSEFKSVTDVIAYAKKNPGKLTYASQGNGTSAHLAGELFTSLAQVDMVHIPYKGASQAITDVLGGQFGELLFEFFFFCHGYAIFFSGENLVVRLSVEPRTYNQRPFATGSGFKACECALR
jgi:tripartite-type tricarboxylate transporter receptor subunit TctC